MSQHVLNLLTSLNYIGFEMECVFHKICRMIAKMIFYIYFSFYLDLSILNASSFCSQAFS